MLTFYNTLTNQVEEFKSKKKGIVNIYYCGPTVYNDVHIGNARPLVFFDCLARYFKLLGYKVRLVSNITDLDEKIIVRAESMEITPPELAAKYTIEYNKIAKKFNTLKFYKQPHAMEYMPKMIEFIDELIKNDYAYINKSGVYFRVSKIADYGVLSNQRLDNTISDVRITNESDKEFQKDFALFKFVEEGYSLDSPWGKGIPGWHTECVVMNYEIFKNSLDIHGGGIDLKFPHHDNEICQFEALTNEPLAPYWIHTGHINLEGAKMSKSTGNLVLAKDILAKYSQSSIRLLIMSNSFNAPINYSDDLMTQYEKNYSKIYSCIVKSNFTLYVNDIEKVEHDEELLNEYIECVNNNLNFSNGISLLFGLVKQINSLGTDYITLAKKLKTLEIISDSLGLYIKFTPKAKQKELYFKWKEQISLKNYKEADAIRAKLIKDSLV